MPYLVEPALPAGSLAALPQPVISGDGLTLRPWTQDDVPTLVDAYADPDVQQWHCRTLDATEARALVTQWAAAWVAETDASWAVEAPDGVLGRVALRDVDLAQGCGELAYWVLSAARRRGVASTAAGVLTRWCFAEVGLNRLELEHAVANTGSCQVALAAGYRVEGTRRSALRHADGWHDMHLHARLRTD